MLVEGKAHPVYQIKTFTELMNSSGLNISKVWPIRVVDNTLNGAWVEPSLSHIEIIPTLYRILQQINDDWMGEASKFSFSSMKAPSSDRTAFLFYALDELKPRYIQCLFSYINFFFTLENGFSVFHDELKHIKDELDLKIKINKKPKRPSYVEKLRLVRNHTVTHWGGPDKKHGINSRAGRMWGFSFPGDADNLVELAFGSSSLVGADDRSLLSIPETHKICMSYIKSYDDICADLLNQIISYLPIKIGNREYSSTKPQ